MAWHGLPETLRSLLHVLSATPVKCNLRLRLPEINQSQCDSELRVLGWSGFLHAAWLGRAVRNTLTREGTREVRLKQR